MIRVAILTPTLTSADAVSNDVLSMRRVLSERGHEVRIFAESTNIADRAARNGVVILTHR